MQRTFTAESLDAKVHFQLLSLEKQLFVWADAGSGRLSALVLAGTSTPVSPLLPFHLPARYRTSDSTFLQRHVRRIAECDLTFLTGAMWCVGPVAADSRHHHRQQQRQEQEPRAAPWYAVAMKSEHTVHVVVLAIDVCGARRSNEDRASSRLLLEPACRVSVSRRECWLSIL